MHLLKSLSKSSCGSRWEMSLEIFTFTLVTLVFVPPLLCPNQNKKWRILRWANHKWRLNMAWIWYRTVKGNSVHSHGSWIPKSFAPWQDVRKSWQSIRPAGRQRKCVTCVCVSVYVYLYILYIYIHMCLCIFVYVLVWVSHAVWSQDATMRCHARMQKV